MTNDLLSRMVAAVVFCMCGSAASNAIAAPLAQAATPGFSFPSQHLLPKEEIGAREFIEKNPAFDGRGVVVAIFDTGVDPGAAGLQFTSDGRVKIIDMVDATGSGDVDTSTVREASNGEITGLTGRTLRVGAGWQNPSGKYHVGMKAAYELFPSALVRRLKEKRREHWQEAQRQEITGLQREIAAWKSEHPEADPDRKKQGADLETRLEQLRALTFDDPGPVFDCVVFHDGERWQAVVDTDEDGHLEEEQVMTNYRLAQQFSTFSQEDMLNFAVNIYEQGKVLSIVVDSGMHGTHVAGITAAHFPDRPELNGIAPGAQIVSVKIGDTRLDGMETASAFVRGLIAVQENQCDLINLSYGEPTARPNAGGLTRLLSEFVNEHGIVFVASAGNAGPALSTVGAPGGTTSALIGVGAYVSPAMMESAHSLRSALPEMQYTWSSRGPTFDGDLGVNISAPGGAISPVPTWTLQRNQLANGTSMAAPNVSGGVALILSGLKAEGVAFNPGVIRRGLENTAREVEGIEVFAQGRGLLQVGPAFDWCRAHAGLDPRIEISLPGRSGARGVYLRGPYESGNVLETAVQVRPVFPEEAPHGARIDYERSIRLVSTVPWVQAPGAILLMHGGRSFEIRVDPTELKPGAHYGEVLGLDAGQMEAGPLFRIPVTVVRGEDLDTDGRIVWRDRFEMRSGDLERRFIHVPHGAEQAELTVRTEDIEGPRRYMLHAVQVYQGKRFSDHEAKFSLAMNSYQTEVRHFPVLAGATLELCTGQLWSSLGEGAIAVEIAFSGLRPSDESLFVDAAARVAPIEVSAPLSRATLHPEAKLTHWRRTLAPANSEIRPLGERDLLPKGRRIHELILSYRFNMDESAEVRPHLPALESRIYDGEFESQLVMIFDAGKRRVAVDDLFDPAGVRLAKGQHQVRLHLRHHDLQTLEKLEDLPLLLDQEMAAPVGLNIYEHPDAALHGGAASGPRSLERGDQVRLYIGSVPSANAPKNSSPGDLLVGTIRYDRSAGQRAYPLIASIPARTAESESEADTAASEPAGNEKIASELLDFRLQQLAKLSGTNEEAYNLLFGELRAQFPDHPRLLAAKLSHLDREQGRGERLVAIIEASDQVIAAIDQTELAGFFGTRHDESTPEVRQRKVEKEKQRDVLVDALHRKGRALAFNDLNLAEENDAAARTESAEIERGQAFEQTFTALGRWVDTTGEKYAGLSIQREWRHGRLGNALELTQKRLDTSPGDEVLLRKRVELLDALGWEHQAELEKRWMLLRFPPAFPPF